MSAPQGAPSQPNILVILSDQLRRAALGCYGDSNVSTPHIDRLASEGVRFQNACVTYPVCVPSRFTLMTGEHAHTRLIPAIGWRMSPAERTIAHELGDAGYETAYFGKWHLFGAHPRGGPVLAKKRGLTPIPRPYRGGFDYWRGFEFRNSPFDTYYFADDDPEPRKIEGYQTDGLFALCERYVSEERDPARPFFAVLSVEPPHFPMEAPEEYLARWLRREVVERANVPPEPDAEKLEKRLDYLRRYYAMVENLDDNVGRLVTALEAHGLRENTVVMLIADHGDMLGSQGLTSKQQPYEESIGVPLIASWPSGGIGGGRALPDVTCSEDWFPTLRGLAGLTAREDKPGVDLAPLMRGVVERVEREGVLLELVMELRPNTKYFDETWRGWRTERFKYTVKGGEAGARPWQLFDLAEDPYEQRNLVDEAAYAEVASRLHGHLREALAESHDDYSLEPAFGHARYR